MPSFSVVVGENESERRTECGRQRERKNRTSLQGVHFPLFFYKVDIHLGICGIPHSALLRVFFFALILRFLSFVRVYTIFYFCLLLRYVAVWTACKRDGNVESNSSFVYIVRTRHRTKALKSVATKEYDHISSKLHFFCHQRCNENKG